MKKIENFVAVTGATLTTLCLTTNETLKGGVLPAVREVIGNNAPAFWTVVSALAVFAVLPQAMNCLAQVAISRSPHLRQLVLGSSFLEGTWVNKVICQRSEAKQIYYGILKIFYQDGLIQITGETFNTSYERIGVFSSKVSIVKDSELIFAFWKDAEDSYSVNGISSYTFQANHPRPFTFRGFYMSSNGEIFRTLEGVKVHKRIDLPENEQLRLLKSKYLQVINLEEI